MSKQHQSRCGQPVLDQGPCGASGTTNPTSYQVLHVHPGAPADLIAAAYWKLVSVVRSADPSDRTMRALHKLTKAYETLSTPESRSSYDAYLGIEGRLGPPSGRRSRRTNSRSNGRDYYEILGVDPLAHPAVIAEAHGLMRNHYLGLVAQGRAEPQLVDLLHEAYAVLADADARRRYDEARATYLARAAVGVDSDANSAPGERTRRRELSHTIGRKSASFSKNGGAMLAALIAAGGRASAELAGTASKRLVEATEAARRRRSDRLSATKAPTRARPSGKNAGLHTAVLPFLPLLAVPLIGTAPEDLDRIILAIEIIFLLMAIRNPVWVLGALILSELTIRNYHFEFLASVVILLPHFARVPNIGPKGRMTVMIAGAFVASVALAEMAAYDLGDGVSYLRSLLVGVVALTLIPLVIRTRDDLRNITSVALIIACASALVAILQQLSGGYIVQLAVERLADGEPVRWVGRSTGLATNSVRLSNDLTLFLFPVLGVLLMQGVPRKLHPYLTGVAIVFVVALYFSQTRTWIPSALAAAAIMALLTGRRYQREFLLLVAVGAVALAGASAIHGGRYSRDLSSDSSAASRPVLWGAGLNIALDNPILGVGHAGFLELAPRYAHDLAPGLLAHQNAGESLGRLEPHNDYINVWVSFGLPGLGFYLLLLVLTGGNFIQVARQSSDPLFQGIALGGLGTLMAFGVNSFFHNLFTATLTVWLLAGLSLALVNLARQDTDRLGGATT